jgi:16S rRNA (adenine1518-N6/adenine1519-N6)-dimethyltransferase
MVEHVGLAGREVVVEIGGGRGAMTALLAERARRLVVVEIDRALAAALAERFRGDAHVTVVAGDILDVDLDRILEASGGERAIAFGNIPYYASSPILLWLAEHADRFDRAYLTLQREVASRLVAAPGTKEYGTISVRLAYAGAARVLFAIAPGAFRPRPKVVSSFVEIAFHADLPVAVRDEALLFRLVRAAFAQRRKTLRNTLPLLPEAPAARVPEIAARAGIDLRRRGETLSLSEFARLADAVAAR